MAALTKPKKHVLICTNRREENHPKSCCADRGSEDVYSQLKAKIHEMGLKPKYKVTQSSCLGPCHLGVTMVVYPEGTWYGKMTSADIEEFIQGHLIAGHPIQRLVISEKGE